MWRHQCWALPTLTALLIHIVLGPVRKKEKKETHQQYSLKKTPLFWTIWSRMVEKTDCFKLAVNNFRSYWLENHYLGPRPLARTVGIYLGSRNQKTRPLGTLSGFATPILTFLVPVPARMCAFQHHWDSAKQNFSLLLHGAVSVGEMTALAVCTVQWN